MRPLTQRLLTATATLVIVVPLTAQPGRAVTAADYARAEKFLAQNLTGLVVGGTVAATWLDGDRFWYRHALADGAEFILVDPSSKTRARLRSREARRCALDRDRRQVRRGPSAV